MIIILNTITFNIIMLKILLLIIHLVNIFSFDEIDEFNLFQIKFNKTYLTGIEYERRFLIFKLNLQLIREHNYNIMQNFTLEINQFGDLTPFEFKKYYIKEIKFNQEECNNSVNNNILLKNVIILQEPLYALIKTNIFCLQFYNNGVLDSKLHQEIINSTVLIIGYGIDYGLDFWLIKNSWNNLNIYIKILKTNIKILNSNIK